MCGPSRLRLGRRAKGPPNYRVGQSIVNLFQIPSAQRIAFATALIAAGTLLPPSGRTLPAVQRVYLLAYPGQLAKTGRQYDELDRKQSSPTQGASPQTRERRSVFDPPTLCFTGVTALPFVRIRVTSHPDKYAMRGVKGDLLIAPKAQASEFSSTEAPRRQKELKRRGFTTKVEPV